MPHPYTMTATNSVAWNGPVCPTCVKPYVGTHKCSRGDLLRRIAYLYDLLDRADDIPAPVGDRWKPETEDRTRSCPCRPENGGSGVCGCILGGPRIT